MSIPADFAVIPTFVKARSASGLQRLLLQRSAKRGAIFKLIAIVWNDSDKSWYAWFYDRIENDLTANQSNQDGEV